MQYVISKTTIITFYVVYGLCRFPKNEALRRHWVEATRRIEADGTPWTPGVRAMICSEHFCPDDFVVHFGLRTIKPGAVPTLFVIPHQVKWYFK